MNSFVTAESLCNGAFAMRWDDPGGKYTRFAVRPAVLNSWGSAGFLQFTESLRIVICGRLRARVGRGAGELYQRKRRQVANKLKTAPTSAKIKTRKSHVWAFKVGHDQAQEGSHGRQARPRVYPRHPRNYHCRSHRGRRPQLEPATAGGHPGWQEGEYAE